MVGLTILFIIIIIAFIVTLGIVAYTIYSCLTLTVPIAVEWKYDEEDPIDGYVDYYDDSDWIEDDDE